MPMDPQLAALYQTNQDDGDVEKLAAAELAEQLEGEGEVDTSDLTAEQAEELAAEVLAAQASAGGEEEGEEEEEVSEEQEKTSAEAEAKAKLAEADYLGRVMAHAYVQELRKISSAQEEPAEKTASKTKEALSPRNAARLTRAGMTVRHHGGKAAAGGMVASFMAGRGSKKGGKSKKSAVAPQQEEQAQEMSALDTLALQRAQEIAESLQAEQQEKTSASEEQVKKLQAAVDARAMEMLREAGYEIGEPEKQEKTEAKGEEQDEVEEKE